MLPNRTFWGAYLQQRDLLVTDDAFFFISDADSTASAMWKSDGTAAGMVRFLAFPSIGELFHWQGSVYFAGNDGISGLELWRTDGTASGTELVYDHGKSADSQPHHLTIVDETLFFTADDGVSPSRQLWKANEDGTALLAAPYARYPYGYDLINFIAFKNELVFTHQYMFSTGKYSGNAYSLWKSDGTREGTQGLSFYFYSYYEFNFAAAPSYQAVINDRLYFESGWYDGEQSEILEGPSLEPNPKLSHFMRVGDQLFFSRVDEHGRELWVTEDGFQTSRLVKDIEPGRGSGTPQSARGIRTNASNRDD